MSSKETKLFTQDSEHWYIETAQADDTGSSVVVQIDTANIHEMESNEDCIEITLRGNCELAQFLRSAHYPGFEAKIKGQNDVAVIDEKAFFDRERFARVVKSAVEGSKTNG